MKEIGQLLKEKREQLNISLEEISMATKISIKHLQALEEGNESKLPAKTFIRGFVQSYAKYLGIDVNEVMSRFHNEMGPTNAQTNIPVPERTDFEKDVVGSGARILFGLGVVACIIVIIIAERVISKREAEMKDTQVQAITGTDKPVAIPQSSPTPGQEGAAATAAASPSPGASPASTAAASPTPAASPSPTATPQASATPAAAVAATPTPTPKPTATPTPVASPSPSATPQASATPNPKEGPQEVIIEALDQVTVVVTIDNKPAQEVKMNPDQILTFKAKSKMKVFTPNGGAISLINNGFEIGVPGNLGQPKTMVFPQ